MASSSEKKGAGDGYGGEYDMYRSEYVRRGMQLGGQPQVSLEALLRGETGLPSAPQVDEEELRGLSDMASLLEQMAEEGRGEEEVVKRLSLLVSSFPGLSGRRIASLEDAIAALSSLECAPPPVDSPAFSSREDSSTAAAGPSATEEINSRLLRSFDSFLTSRELPIALPPEPAGAEGVDADEWDEWDEEDENGSESANQSHERAIAKKAAALDSDEEPFEVIGEEDEEGEGGNADDGRVDDECTLLVNEAVFDKLRSLSEQLAFESPSEVIEFLIKQHESVKHFIQVSNSLPQRVASQHRNPKRLEKDKGVMWKANPFNLPGMAPPSVQDIAKGLQDLEQSTSFYPPSSFVAFSAQVGPGTIGRCRIYVPSASFGFHDMRMHAYRLAEKFRHFPARHHSFRLDQLVAFAQDVEEDLWFGWLRSDEPKQLTPSLADIPIYCFDESEDADPPTKIAQSFQEWVECVALGPRLQLLGLKKYRPGKSNDKDEVDSKWSSDDNDDDDDFANLTNPPQTFLPFPKSPLA